MRRRPRLLALLAATLTSGLLVLGPVAPPALAKSRPPTSVNPLAGLLLPSSGWVSEDTEIKLAGFADVPPAGAGGTLTLPLAPGSLPVTLIVTFGIPSVQVAVMITPATAIKSESGPPVTLADGDRVKIEAAVVNGSLQAVELELEAFPELELVGTAQGLPTAGVVLPLAPGTTVDFTLAFGVSGASLPIRLTADTKVEGGPVTLVNGVSVEVDAVVRGLRIVATELSLESNATPDD